MKTKKSTMRELTRTSSVHSILFVMLMGFALVNNAIAQDWKDLDAKTVTTLVDTTLLRASEITIMPGEKGNVHTHPAHYFYALTEAHLVVHYTDGKTERYDVMPGDSGFSNPERPHRTENVGTKPAKFLLVELKEHPYKVSGK